MNLFHLVLYLPLLGFVLLAALPRNSAASARKIALGVSTLVFLASLLLIPTVLSDPAGYQFSTDVQWITYPNIRYHVGVDSISLWLILLTTLLAPLAVLASWNNVSRKQGLHYALLLLLEFSIIGVFSALDLFLFYVFWEVTLVPIYLLVGMWGQKGRVYASTKYFVYMMAGSLPLLGAIIFLYTKSGTFDYVTLLELLQTGKLVLSAAEQNILFLAFFLAFAVKAPFFPLHTWLPDAQGEGPVAASLMLVIKMGTYGLLRFCIPLFPNASRENSAWIVPFALIAIIYGAMIALIQPNMKRLLAYATLSHAGFVVLGLFSLNQLGLDGAVYQMLNSGVSTGALFLLVSYLNDRRSSFEIKDYGGLAGTTPWLATIFLLTTLSSIGLPLLNSFVGEFLILQGAAMAQFEWAVVAAVGVILSACYMLWFYQRTFFGKVDVENGSRGMRDLSTREWAAVLPLVVLMVWMGVAAQTFLPSIAASNANILKMTSEKLEQQVNAPKVVADSH
jgi:NADH-quinone oxidoreductase subunit M